MKSFIMPAVGAAAIAASLSAGAGAASAETAASERAPERTIVVNGLGESSAAPDMAIISIGVSAEGETAGAALREANARMKSTIDALKKDGIAPKDLQTSNLSLQARYDYEPRNSPPKLIGYTAENTLTVRLRNLDKAGAVLDRTVASGANRMNGFSFGFADQSALLAEARHAAVADARQKAELYAAAAGVKLGPVMRISEGGSYGPQPIAAERIVMSAAKADSVPIESGEQTLNATVTIVYAIN